MIIRIVLFISFLHLSLLLQAQLYTFKTYNHKDGLGIATTLSTAQDELGYLYVGTDGNGFVRFDGSTFKSILKATDIPYHVTDFIFKDKTIYFSTLYNGLNKLENGKISQINKSFFDKQSQNARMTSFKDHLIYITTNNIIICDFDGKIIKQRATQKNKSIIVRQILKTPYGQILFTNQGNFIVTETEILNLNDWLHVKSETFTFGLFSGNVFKAFDVKGKQIAFFKFDNQGAISSFTTKKENFEVLKDSVTLATSKGSLIYLATASGDLEINFFKLVGDKLEKLNLNVPTPKNFFNRIFIDRSGELWANSTKGLHKINIEPFTKIEKQDILSNSLISSVLVFNEKDYILSAEDGIYYGDMSKSEYEHLSNLRFYHIMQTPQGIILCTNDGLYAYENKKVQKIHLKFIEHEKISFALWDKDKLWFTSNKKGLICYDFTKHKAEIVIPLDKNKYYYTGQVSQDGKTLYLGTSNNIIAVDLKTKSYKRLTQFKSLGYFCGNSTKDIYGNLWFTMDRGIAGITPENKYVTITDKKHLPSILLYTLSSDNHGNLIVGTNIGVHVLSISKSGKVLRSRTFDSSNGFEGYETNMRSVYQEGNKTYFGTIQGLFQLNTDVLMNMGSPPKPLVHKGIKLKDGVYQDLEDGTYFSFTTILPRIIGVEYYYKIHPLDKKWKKLLSKSELKIPELENGIYELEVKSTYDNFKFSKSTRIKFEIQNPIWESKWFIIFIVLMLGAVNIFYLEWTRLNVRTVNYEIEYNIVNEKLVPKLIFSGAILNFSISLCVYLFVDQEVSYFFISIAATTCLMILWILIALKRRKGALKMVFVNYSFYLTFIFLLIQYFILLYMMSIHPYPLIAIIITTSTFPYLFKNIYTVTLIGLIQICLSIFILLWVESPQYNGFLFITAMVMSSSLIILMTYLRNESLEKLYFINNILNKGNMIVISFDQRGLINFCSNNISKFFNLDSAQLLEKSISNLNAIVVSEEMRNVSLMKEFEDGHVFLVPMYNHRDEVIWIEWSCKYISSTNRVIMGQDVTEKLTISTNYEALVENAHDLIFNTDIHENFTFLNEMSSRIFGNRNDSLIGASSISIVHPDYQDQVRAFYQNQFKNRIQKTYLEFPIIAHDGRVIWLGQNSNIVFEPGSRKRIAGFTALARDITERRAKDLLIEQQNRDITSSINAAKSIQYSLIPKNTDFGKYFEDYFVLFKPKDIVSGDFYWLHEQNNKVFLVLADCAGHGVPGAFMTIMGINILNQLVIERGIEKPCEILYNLNKTLNTMMHKEEDITPYDGMSTIVVAFEKDEVSFASSGVSLLHIANNDVSLHRTTKTEMDGQTIFECLRLNFHSDDKLYLITNGLQNQFGSLKNKKFSFRRIMELTNKVHIESMPLQKKYFENAWSNWSEGHEQTDDITIIGLKNFKYNKVSDK